MPRGNTIPKPPEKRARRNKDLHGLHVIVAKPTKQPPLPTIHITKDDELVEFRWPAQTEAWWKMWGESPLSAEFTANDWSELLDTALIHAKFWSGDVKAAAELRLRVAKFGATPEDRARLRIVFAQADEAESKPKASRGTAARQRRGPLKAV